MAQEHQEYADGIQNTKRIVNKDHRRHDHMFSDKTEDHNHAYPLLFCYE